MEEPGNGLELEPIAVGTKLIAGTNCNDVLVQC